MIEEVIPLLGDEEIYTVFGGVLRVLATLKRLGEYFLSQFHIYTSLKTLNTILSSTYVFFLFKKPTFRIFFIKGLNA